MPRKVTKKLQRRLQPDRKYQSTLVQRLINKSMLDGKKLVAERAVYSALEIASKKLNSEEPLEVFEQALRNITPNFEVKSRRVRGDPELEMESDSSHHQRGETSLQSLD